MKIHTIAGISLATLLGCATIPIVESEPIIQNDVSAFVNTMLGEFETLPENEDGQILDRRVRISSPNLNGHWIYSQLNTGTDKKVYRQRVSNLTVSEDGMSIVQKSYTLNEPEKYTEFWGQTGLFNSLSENDLERFANEGCVQKWTRAIDAGWSGYVDPATCLIRSKRRNVDIRVEAETKINGNTVKTNERGYSVDMEQIWGSEPGEFIILMRK